jgi:hypothetical protein
MDKKRGIFIIVFLVLFLGVVNAVWIISYSSTITTNVIGQEKEYSFSHEFNESLSLDTSDGPANTTTTWIIEDLEEDINMEFDVETRKNSSDTECTNGDDDYKKDCKITITHIYDDGSGEIRSILSNTTNIQSSGEVTLMEDIDNIIEYKVECVPNSCTQEIVSTIEFEEIVDTY